jgi:hypothetical protein
MTDSPGLQKLTEAACWALVREVTIGRLAVNVGGRPEIFPVNYVVDSGSLVFRTAEGTKASATLDAAPVAFEVDGYASDTGEAWSVVLKGHTERVHDFDEAQSSVRLPLYPWHDGPKSIFVRVVPEEVTGRRFPVADSASWRSSLASVRPAPPE